MSQSLDPRRVWPIAYDYYDDLLSIGEVSVLGPVHIPLGYPWVRRLTGLRSGAVSIVLAAHHLGRGVHAGLHFLTLVRERDVYEYLLAEARWAATVRRDRPFVLKSMPWES